jgi:hypothetical protein
MPSDFIIQVTPPAPVIIEVGGRGPVAAGPTTAANVSYTGSYPTVQAALDALLYVPPVVSSVSLSVSSVEDGSTVNDFVLSWSLNKQMESVVVSPTPGSLPPTTTSYSFTGAGITSNTTFTVTAGDGSRTSSASASMSFRNKRWWGLSADPGASQSLVQALSGELASSRSQSRTFAASGGQYIYFAWPTAFGEPAFIVGGLTNTAWVRTEIPAYTNQSGKVVPYTVYRSQYPQNGTVQVSVT